MLCFPGAPQQINQVHFPSLPLQGPENIWWLSMILRINLLLQRSASLRPLILPFIWVLSLWTWVFIPFYQVRKSVSSLLTWYENIWPLRIQRKYEATPFDSTASQLHGIGQSPCVYISLSEETKLNSHTGYLRFIAEIFIKWERTVL